MLASIVSLFSPTNHGEQKIYGSPALISYKDLASLLFANYFDLLKIDYSLIPPYFSTSSDASLPGKAQNVEKLF